VDVQRVVVEQRDGPPFLRLAEGKNRIDPVVVIDMAVDPEGFLSMPFDDVEDDLAVVADLGLRNWLVPIERWTASDRP
jgi:hypothetical protein